VSIWGRRAALAALELLLVASVVVLAVTGFGAVLDTTHGTAIDPELDPSAPGYEAFVEASATLAVLGRDDAGALAWVNAFALAGGPGAGGAVFLVPVATLVPDFSADLETLAQVDAGDGADATRQAVANTLGAGMGDIVELDPTRLAELVRPVAPLTVLNPDAADGFASGELSLGAEDVPRFLLATEAGESDLTRLARHEALWQAWFAAVGASADPDVVPGETDSGIGRFLRGLAGGPVTVDVPPVEPEAAADGSTVFRLDVLATFDLMEQRIPFPAAPRPGARVRIRVLDGVGADELAVRAGRDVVRAGGQVVVVGNSDRFDPEAATRVVYVEPDVADEAEIIADHLGVVAELIGGPNPDDGVDITVVAGADLLAAYGLTPRATIGGDAG